MEATGTVRAEEEEEEGASSPNEGAEEESMKAHAREGGGNEEEGGDHAKETTPEEGGSLPSHPPHLLREYTVLLEYKHLPERVPSGVFVLPSAKSLFEWHGVLFLRQGLYRKGIFKFVLTIPETYPEVPPGLRFATPVFHPLISPQGEVDMKRAFPRGWVAYRDQIWCVLTYMKKLFYQIETDSALNIDAASLFLADFAKFKQRVSACVEDSIKNVYINDTENTSLRFLEWDPKYEKLRKYILEEDQNEGIISWVSKGVSKIINIRY